jgi:Ca2+-binding EF-hand superfamily protein
MYKLNELKHTFIKNNRKRRNLNGLFSNFAKDGKVGTEEMKNIVREYGYDVTDDEAKIIFRLSGAKEDYIAIDQFIELMTKENVHFKTLKLDGAFGKARSHFD